MSETPETDAVWLEVAKIDAKHVPRVLRDHAEKLERERDEARKIADQWRRAYGREIPLQVMPRQPWEK